MHGVHLWKDPKLVKWKMWESHNSWRPLPFINMVTYLSQKAVLTVHAFMAVLDMLPHGHKNNIPRKTFTKPYWDLCRFWQQFHRKSLNISTDKEADCVLTTFRTYSDKFLYKFCETVHRISKQWGCCCRLYFSFQKHTSIVYMVALEPDSSWT